MPTPVLDPLHIFFAGPLLPGFACGDPVVRLHRAGLIVDVPCAHPVIKEFL